MNIHSIQEATERISAEYPDINFKIVKQFSSKGAQKRTYNTFQLETFEYGLIIAKSFVVNPKTLELEWNILKQLNKENKNAPKLILPDKKPENFMLMEYINAKDASTLLKKNPNDLSIFNLIGSCLGNFHTSQANWFGNPIEKEEFHDNWESLMKDKVDNRVKGLNNILDAGEYETITKFYKNIRELFLADDISTPILLHRDIYIENFLIKGNKEVTLIDYGMVYGGRPWYDLAKFYIADLTEHTNAKSLFLDSYSQYVHLPENLNDLLRYYIFAELTGMLLSHKRYGHKISYNLSHKMLMELIEQTGNISKLLE